MTDTKPSAWIYPEDDDGSTGPEGRTVPLYTLEAARLKIADEIDAARREIVMEFGSGPIMVSTWLRKGAKDDD